MKGGEPKHSKSGSSLSALAKFMKRYFIITGTITYAIKCREALRQHGYKAELKRTVNSGGNVGCGYGVITVCSLDEIKEILFMYSIRYLQIKEVEN